MPIEHDTKMTKEEKIPFMIEWWTKTFELICESQVTKANLIEIVRNSTTHLKEGCKWLFNTLENYDIPLVNKLNLIFLRIIDFFNIQTIIYLVDFLCGSR